MSALSLFFFLLILPPPRSTLFPYTTLFRSCACTSARPRPRSGAPHRMRRCRGSPCPTAPGSRRTSSSRSEEHTSELQSHSDLVCRLLLEKKKKTTLT